jgi:hypothetical protein
MFWRDDPRGIEKSQKNKPDWPKNGAAFLTNVMFFRNMNVQSVQVTPIHQDVINKYPYRGHHAWVCACARQAGAE